VYVSVSADAAAKCETTRNAFGCAAAEAMGVKQQSARIRILREAAAKAINV